MTSVILDPAALEAIRHHGESTYPEECCGFLLGKPVPSDGIRRIFRAVPSHNQFIGSRGRRYVIAPEEVAEVERQAEQTSQQLLGFYHSHPDHPAVPSQFDQENAWPWYTYCIVAVEDGRASEFGAFELDSESRQFHTVPHSVGPERALSAEAAAAGAVRV
jgi:proteasome lid subunit RPN8/RPN11